jgi:hypothetical protein
VLGDRAVRVTRVCGSACLLAVASGLVVCTHAVAAGKHGRALCAVHRCRTLAADPNVSVFQATVRRPLEQPYRSSFARWLPTGRVTALGDEIIGGTSTAKLELLAVAERFAAYAIRDVGGVESYVSWKVYRLNVQTGRRDAVRASSRLDTFNLQTPGVTDVVVTPTGTAAWIVGGAQDTPSTYQVFMLLPGSKSPALLASATTIEPKSLAGIPGHLYWTEAGTARSVPIA